MTSGWVLALDVAIVVAIGAVAVGAGSPLVRWIFGYIQRRDTELPTLIPTPPRTLRGGTWIGMLERISVYAAVLAGWKETLAIVLVIKGLARYPELSAPDGQGAERFIIGTFVSVLFAVGCAAAALWLISLTG